MSTESEAPPDFHPKNDVDKKIAARLKEIWEQDAKTWKPKVRLEFRNLCPHARVTAGTCIASSHKLHRAICGRKATDAEYIILSTLFGTENIEKLVWGAEFKKRTHPYPREEGVVTREDKRALKAAAKSGSNDDGEARRAHIEGDGKKLGVSKEQDESKKINLGQEVPRTIPRTEATKKEEEFEALEAKKYTDGLGWIRQGFDDIKGDMKKIFWGIESIKEEADSTGAGPRKIKAETAEEDGLLASIEPACNNPGDVGEDNVQEPSTRADERTSGKRKRNRNPRLRVRRRKTNSGQSSNDVETLPMKLNALESRCIAQEDKSVALEAIIADRNEEIETLRQQVDTIRRYLALDPEM